MRILILEDTEVRKNAFLSALVKHGISARVCQTADDCVESLANESWDWITLDHDVVVPEEHARESGYDVAKWLEENPDRVPGVVMVHSANPVGQSNLRAALPQAILAPNLWEYVNEVITKLNL
jgi:DNA-binding response OmpR family regulator